MGLVMVTSPVHADTVQDQYQATLIQLITLLQQQVALLMEQLQAVTASQAQVANQVQQIVQNTTPVPVVTPIVFGSVAPVVVKDLNLWADSCIECGLNTYGITIDYKENGNPINGISVTLMTDSGGFDGSPHITNPVTLLTRDMGVGGNGRITTGFVGTATTTYIKASANGVEKIYQIK